MGQSEALELLARAPRLQLGRFDGSLAVICPVILGDGAVFPWPFDGVPQGRAFAVASEHVTRVPDPLGHGTLFLEARVEGDLSAVAFSDVALELRTLGIAARPTDRWARLAFNGIAGRSALAQDWAPQDRTRLLEALWERGLPEDPQIIERIRAANPGTPTPAFLEAPEGSTLFCAMGPAHVQDTVRLLEETWPVDIPAQSWAEAHRHSSAWVGASDETGRIIATARGVGDWTRNAWIYDVVVAPEWRRRRLASALMRVLLEHPAMRNVARITLRATEIARPLYFRCGFLRNGPPADDALEMIRFR
jgi:GNAT superfamily N-acetyltransferase